MLGGLLITPSCRSSCSPNQPQPTTEIDFVGARNTLVADLRAAGIHDPAVLRAVGATPREEFVLEGDRYRAYLDRALQIRRGQTISQPYIVARMTELLEVDDDDRVLEVGTGSGYQAAVLAELVKSVYTIEIDPALADEARERLDRLGYRNVHVRAGDGFYGWPEAGPFDAAIITAATPRVPERIVAQLKPGGRLVLPLDEGRHQWLVRGRKHGDELEIEHVVEVIFVPMTGEIRRSGEPQPAQ